MMLRNLENEHIWAERYRPTNVGDCILPDRLKLPFIQYVKSKEFPNLLLTGTPGIGKTATALASCEEAGVDYLFINASKERGIDTLRNEIQGFASTVSFHNAPKVIILDEGDNLTAEAQLALRGTMQECSSNCTFIVTCNYKSKLIDAIHSRCDVIDFKISSAEKPHMMVTFLKRIIYILDSEKIEYEKPVLAKVIDKFFPDYRKTLNELQRLSQFGKIDSNSLNLITDIRKPEELYSALKEKNFSKVRKWVNTNSDVDVSTIFRKVYDSINEYLQQSSIAPCILLIAKYQYQHSFVADPEINLMALFVEMMVDLEWQ